MGETLTTKEPYPQQAPPADSTNRTDYLVDLLRRQDGDLLAQISDPAQFDLETATDLLRVLRQGDPQVEVRLLRMIMPGESSVTAPVMDRVVALLERVTVGPKLLPMLLQLFRSADSRVRARLTALIGRHHRNKEWIEERLRDPNPRVRANMIEVFLGEDSPEALEIFRRALQDPAPRAVANAGLGLYRAGSVEALAILARRLGGSADSQDRASGAWAMGRTGDVRFQGLLTQFVKDPDPIVRRNAFRALSAIKRESAAPAGRSRCDIRFIKLHRAGKGVLHILFEVLADVSAPPAAAKAKCPAIKGIKPLEVAVFENESPVYNYHLQERVKYPEPGVYDLHFKTPHAASTAVRMMLKVEVSVATPKFHGTHASYWFGE